MMRKHFLPLNAARIGSLVLAIVLSVASMAAGEDWPQWRGPKRDGKSTETALLEKWPDGGPRMLWSIKNIGQGYSSVSVADGLIYVTGLKGAEGILYALTMDGQVKWKVTYGPEWASDGKYPSARSSPTVDDGLVYVFSGFGRLSCFDAKTSEKKWQVDTLKRFKGRNLRWGLAESVLIDGDNVICAPGGQNAAIVALNKKTGETVWTSMGLGDKAAYCSPILVKDDSRHLIVTVTALHIVGIDAKTGRPLWSHPFKNKYSVHPNTPIYSNGMICILAGYRYGGIMLKLSADGTSAERVWRNKNLSVHHGGAILLSGRIYGIDERRLIALDAKTGEVAVKTDSVKKGSLTFADGMFYCYDEKRGVVSLVRPTADKLQVVSTFRITRGKRQHWAHPVVSGGRLYIRHGEVLMAYDISSSGAGG